MPYSEKQLRSTLKQLADNWNNDYWIFVEAGDVHLMRKCNGERAYLPNYSVDMSLSVDVFPKIDADGGAV